MEQVREGHKVTVTSLMALPRLQAARSFFGFALNEVGVCQTFEVEMKTTLELHFRGAAWTTRLKRD